MGLFGNKKKKIEETNTYNKNQIISTVTALTMSNRLGGEIASYLKDIQLEMQNQGNSSSEEVMKLDALILSLLQEVSVCLSKQQSTAAVNKLEKIKKAVAERQSYCIMGGQKTKADLKREQQAQKTLGKMAKQGIAYEKSRAEELQDRIDEENAKLADLNKAFEKLRERHAANPTDRSIISQANVCKMEITNTVNKLNGLQAELEREKTTTIFEETYNTNAELVNGRTVSDDQMQVYRENIAETNQRRAEEQSQVAADMAALGAGSAFGALGDPFAEGDAFGAFGDPFATTTAGTAATSQTMGGATALGGVMGTAEMANDINRTRQALQQSIDTYNDKIDDVQDELNDLNAQLKPLLIKRKTASPSDCLILDGQIDQLNAKRNGVQYSIRRYRNALSTLQEQLLLIDKLSTQQDLEATNMKINQMTGGRFADYQGLATYLKEAVAKSNEQLDEIGVAGAVADSEEINMNTFAGAAAAYTDMNEEKDEAKYESLEKDLGLIQQ
ncbi:MAG: hypothetical protein K2K38_01000 [Clostridia bacterium]|nr:hypothetical protein [Clostridia bacterium]